LKRIFTILPKGEGFSPQQFGAIALCVRDFALASKYKSSITIIGGVPGPGFDGIRSLTPPPARWFEKRTRAYARGVVEILNREQADLAEIHNRPVLVPMIAQSASCRLALHLHNDPQDMDGTQTPGKRLKLLTLCDGVYCVSNYIRDRFLEGLPSITESKLRMVHNGIKIPVTLPAKDKLILFAGRMTEGKGALLLAQALRNCLPNLPGWRAVLIGARRHEAGRPLTAHEKEIVDMLAPLVTQVKLTGFLPYQETLDYFAHSAIAVVPSEWQEPFGRTALEGMAYGCAVISSGRGALREVTADAALTLDTLTPQALADAITRLARDDAERARLQGLAVKRAQAFAINDCTRVLDTARDSILAGGNRDVA